MVADNMSDTSSNMGDMPHPTSPMHHGSGMMRSPGEEGSMMGLPPHSSLFCSRKQREFTPDSKKDDTYWDRRRRNNAAAKRSREKRRLNDMLLEKRVVQLARENHILRAQVNAVLKSYGIRAETLIDMDQVMATLPTEDQLLNMAPCSRPLSSLSPPPHGGSMMSMGSPPSPPPPQSPQATPHPLEDLYRHSHHFNTSRDSQASGLRSPATPVQISPRSPPPMLMHATNGQSAIDSDLHQNCANGGVKRAYMAWDQVHERRTGSSSSNVSSSCDSNSSGSGSDDPLNLTCKSRSRSSSENEDELHHMPLKMRHKHHPEHQSEPMREEY